ncbi:phage tail sheath subtilisin-like domain-containing protein, partial [Nocardia heshunensis]
AGTKGNDLTVSVEKDPNDETLVNVNTLFGTELVAQQQVRTTTASGLESNPYVDVEFTGDMTTPTGDASATTGGAEFSATAGKAKLEALAASTTYKLTGGTTEDAEDELDLIDNALSTENYNVVTTAGIAAENVLHGLVATTTKRLREKEGYKIRAVVPALEGGTKYDYEGVSVVNNGVTLADGTELTATQAAGWVAGDSSAANETTSLTYVAYPDAVAANPKRSNEQTIDALNAGQIVFTTRRDGT